MAEHKGEERIRCLLCTQPLPSEVQELEELKQETVKMTKAQMEELAGQLKEALHDLNKRLDKLEEPVFKKARR